MSQVQRFSNGGFVIHRALGMRISAWFDASGKLTDAEFINARGQSRKPSANTMQRLRALAVRS